jgi:CheY-like chemotaxis protein
VDKIFNKDVRVLVVEDDDDNRYLMQLIMEDFGCMFETATNGEEAIEALRKRKFDIVFTDLRMPIMDGIEEAKVIRKDISKELPIVAITAHAMEEVKKECFDVGMNGFIVKGFDSDMFKAELMSWINKSVMN